MLNPSTEQIVKIAAPKKALLYKAALVAAGIVSACTIPTTGYFGFFLVVIMIFMFVMVSRYYDAEYEYSITDGEMTVERIMAQKSRNRCGMYSVRRATLIARLSSQDAMRMESQQLRTVDYTTNTGDESVVVMYTYNDNNELERVYFEPDEKLLDAIKDTAPKSAFKIEIKA